MLLHILNNDVRKGAKDRARKTLPKKLLQIKKSKIHGEGVFALKTIPKGIKFGPYDGLETVESTSGYAWKIRGGRLVDAQQVEFSNWLRYVNCARNINEQNLVAFQFEGNLYYRSVKEIPKGTELLVYYGERFAKMLNIDTKNYFEPVAEKQQENTYACFPCCLGFSSEEYLNKHYENCPHKVSKRSNIGSDEGKS
ncbi:putative ribosomal small subunit assembly [Trypoxylus dichotomus]